MGRVHFYHHFVFTLSSILYGDRGSATKIYCLILIVSFDVDPGNWDIAFAFLSKNFSNRRLLTLDDIIDDACLHVFKMD
jgi:hypothetical protein